MEYETGQPNSIETASDPRFSAFISYSHADAVAVRKLHAQIENYRLPKGLGGIDALNRKRDRVGRVFRDREDLSAAQDLSAAVKDALKRSEVLVVACSPDAKASHWVDQEIAYFRECHPDRPILAAILRGEPAEAFPLALTEGGAEPLAADLRKQGDGWRLGFLKVVAGIAGVPLDRLVQRDSQRQLRRVMAVTGMVALFAIAMGVMATIAFQAGREAELQRTEAERQRAEAESLIEYMLDDLRQELKGVGRLDLMEGVNERALEYYSSQGDISDLPPSSLEQRAAILHLQGEDLELTGDLGAAIQRFTEAHRDTGELLRRDPDNPDRIYSHAQSEFWIGFASWQGDRSLTEKHWSAYLQLAQRLSAVEPGTHRSLMELGYSNGNICELRAFQDRIALALEHCESAIGFVRQAAEKRPDDTSTKLSLANRIGWLADTLRQAGRHGEAIERRREELQIYRQLSASDPQNFVYGFRSTWPSIGIAESQILSGNAQQALRTIDSVVSDLGGFLERDSANGEVATVYVRALLVRADARRELGLPWQSDLSAAKRIAKRFAGEDMAAQISERIEKFEGRKDI